MKVKLKLIKILLFYRENDIIQTELYYLFDLMPYKIFGCKVNKYFLNQRLDYFYQKGNNLDNSLLIATCVVTDRAKNKRVKEAKQALIKGLQVLITGCGSSYRGNLVTESEFYSIYPELKIYSDKIILLPESPEKNGFSYNIGGKSPIYTKHFLVIQNGCDNHCTFCLTVDKRGQHVSRPLVEIIQEIHEIESNGGKEIVITGINLAARGCSKSTKPQETKFPYLLHEILKQTTIPRIRISSMGPEYANDEFFDVIEDDRILPHFHYSIQSFSDSVLRNMGRHYSSDGLKIVLKKTRKLKKQNLISIGADIIVGFPGETESDFQETYNGIQEFGITKLHAFPFSDHTQRERIPASLLPNQISQKVKKERERRLIAKGDEIRNNFIKLNKGISHKVLLEEKKNGKRIGWTENYIQVELDGSHNKGEIVDYIL